MNQELALAKNPPSLFVGSMSISQTLIPYVSEKEQKELDEMFGSPSDYEDEESVDMTDWVKQGHKIS
ncbi:MAG: hypothetical protein WAN66_19200 [Limnoraphis robusta]|uniref:Uncharacterized protein n=1 Tax=Limnoraphis robusta CS-951 TaxID=1637645 RepID=A0A0F5YI29_9CYAN|nr:hypothetical protein [Limnoraphis robusta]KKD38428.1 hypothetical protein WN50_08900 [Limnoraphis robusta CS-951]